jgi:hypothetical protein
MIKKGDLVRHVSDHYCNKFGLGIVTDIVNDASVPMVPVAYVVWQHVASDIIYPPNLFTLDGLVVVSKSPKKGA